MAGTGVDPAVLLASRKDAHEHRVVVDAIAGALEPVCADVTRDGPAAVRFANVTHLATTIRGRLTDRDLTALDLVDRLHPTPAIGGWPAEPARRMIGELEGRRAADMPARAGGSTRAATATSSCPSVARRSTARTHAASRVPAS